MEQLTDIETEVPAQTPEAVKVGEVLRVERERQKISIEDVAARIKFAPKQIEALEVENYQMLPEAPFLRGLVRSYARVLKIDAEPLIAALPGDALPTKMEVVNATIPTQSTAQRLNVLWWIGGVLLLIALVVFLVMKDKVPQEAASAIVVEPVVQEGAAEDEQQVVATSELQVTEQESVAEAEDQAASHGMSANTVETVADSEKQDVPLEELQRRPIHLVFSQESWVEVINSKGEVLISKSNAADTEQWIGGSRYAPYQITIGYAPGVKMYYRGKEIDLSQYVKSANVARLTVE